jgi:excisionase family DNA binding protein
MPRFRKIDNYPGRSLRAKNLKGVFNMDEILTVQEVADYLKVSRSTVWRWCNQGRLLAFKAGHGWRVPRTAVERMIGRQLDPTGQEQEEEVEAIQAW